MCQTLYRLPLWVLVAPKAAFVFSKQPAGAGVSNVETLQVLGNIIVWTNFTRIVFIV